jgi:uncharacterized protein
MDLGRSFFCLKGMTPDRTRNRLSAEKSPYLLQHSGNPVDWYPWGDEAFARARSETKPIFLSVGYATCHWCHVMERESFENPETAGILNESFVCIKVDREERPDVDGLYMSALQAMGQQGGWPMSMFLTPDGRPFYGGTYFPPESKGGRAGFPDLLRRITEVWSTEREKVEESAANVTGFLKDLSETTRPEESGDTDPMRLCYRQIAPTYDEENGGFGRAPKFPRPVALKFLFRYGWKSGESRAFTMALHALRGMMTGGMADHLGGGFHRYSVDAGWRVPHFEKMLYDQAQIVDALLDAYQLTREGSFADAAGAALDYVIRDMTVAEGGFASAEDADSPDPEQPDHSGEGAFYIWSHDEIASILGANAPLFCYVYGVEEEGNVAVDPMGEFAGRNILYCAATEAEAAKRIDSTEDAVRDLLGECRRQLLAARDQRPRPLRDDKVLTAWNGLMIGAMARASRVLRENLYLEAAEKAVACILSKLWDGETLHRRLRDGDVAVRGVLEDYSFLIHGLIELYQASGKWEYLVESQRLALRMLELFGDRSTGGLFDVDGMDKTILVRMKSRYDGAEPAGNSMAAFVLVRLSRLFHDQSLASRAEAILGDFEASLRTQPLAIPLLANVRDMLRQPPEHVVIAGRPDDGAFMAMGSIAHEHYHPDRVIVMLDSSKPLPEGSPWGAMVSLENKSTAYVCRNYACQLPVTDLPALERLLKESSSVKRGGGQ